MDFLTKIDVRLPPETEPEHREQPVAAEVAPARELAAHGTILRLWRKPAQWSNLDIWRSADAIAPHQAIFSLPFTRGSISMCRSPATRTTLDRGTGCLP